MSGATVECVGERLELVSAHAERGAYLAPAGYRVEDFGEDVLGTVGSDVEIGGDRAQRVEGGFGADVVRRFRVSEGRALTTSLPIVAEVAEGPVGVR
jgi:hypothetical protein